MNTAPSSALISDELIEELRRSRFATAQAIANNLSKFNELLPVDVEMAVVRSRRALDSIVRNVSRLEGSQPGTKPLENIISDLQKSGALPAVLSGHCRILKDLGNLAAHGIDDTQYSASTGLGQAEAEVCANSISTISRWYLANILPRVCEEFPYTILHGARIDDDILKGIMAIDDQVYPPEFLNPDIHYEWRARNPDIYTVVVDTNTARVCGYVNAMPIEESYYDGLSQGVINDSRLPAEAIRKFDLPDFYKMWICSIAIDPSYQCTYTYKALIEGFIDKLISLAQRDMFISDVVGDAITPAGQRMAMYAGMKKMCDSEHGSSIYRVTLLPPSLRVTTAKGKKLLTYYRNKYEEFKELF